MRRATEKSAVFTCLTRPHCFGDIAAPQLKENPGAHNSTVQNFLASPRRLMGSESMSRYSALIKAVNVVELLFSGCRATSRHRIPVHARFY